MERPTLQMTLAAMLGLVACVAINFWLFRLGAFWGIVGLNVTKHVAIAYLCQVLGVDRRRPAQSPSISSVLPACPACSRLVRLVCSWLIGRIQVGATVKTG